MRRPTQNDSSYSGFEYRWNYEEYQKSLQRQRRRASGSGMQAFFLTTAFVFLICFSSLVMVLGAAFVRDEAAASLTDGVSDTEEQQKSAFLHEKTTEAETSAPADEDRLDINALESVQAVPEASYFDEENPGLLGILGENVTYADAQRFRLPIGVRIMTVRENKTADRAGLRRDDILLAIENTPITTLTELAAWEQTVTPGKSVSVRIYRGGEELSLELVVEQSIEFGTEHVEYPK